MMKSRKLKSSLFVSLLVVVCMLFTSVSVFGCGDSGLRNITDFHMHMQSKLITDCLNQYWTDTNHPMAAIYQSDPISAETIIGQLNAANIKNGFVISRAYAWGLQVPFLPYAMIDDPNVKLIIAAAGITIESPEQALVQYENNWVMQQAKLYPYRLTPIFSVNPLKDYTKSEIDRCVNMGFRVMKLHLGSSGVDIHNPEQLAALTDILKYAEAKRLKVLMHCGTMFSVPGDGAIIADMLSKVRNLKIILAHMGGAGGDSVDTTMKEIIDWNQANPGKLYKPNIYFDISGTIWTTETGSSINVAGGFTFPATDPTTLHQVALNIKSWGISNILFGSDYYIINTAPYLNSMQALFGNELTSWELYRLLYKQPFDFLR